MGGMGEKVGLHARQRASVKRDENDGSLVQPSFIDGYLANAAQKAATNDASIAFAGIPCRPKERKQHILFLRAVPEITD